jgi:hypothetical protein
MLTGRLGWEDGASAPPAAARQFDGRTVVRRGHVPTSPRGVGTRGGRIGTGCLVFVEQPLMQRSAEMAFRPVRLLRDDSCGVSPALAGICPTKPIPHKRRNSPWSTEVSGWIRLMCPVPVAVLTPWLFRGVICSLRPTLDPR